VMELPEVIFPGSQTSHNQPLYQRGKEDGPPLPIDPHSAGPPKPKVPNIYVKKPHRKQPALGLFLAKPDPDDEEEDWRFRPGKEFSFRSRFGLLLYVYLVLYLLYLYSVSAAWILLK
jgi:hypothetical protein